MRHSDRGGPLALHESAELPGTLYWMTSGKGNVAIGYQAGRTYSKSR
jgi:hypothetical protein